MEPEHVEESAEGYLRRYGQQARAYAESDKSRAIGRRDWAEVVRIATVLDEIARLRG